MEQIIIDIDNDANVQLTVKGIKGASCTKVTEQIEKALGTVESSRKTSDFHQKGQTHVQH